MTQLSLTLHVLRTVLGDLRHRAGSAASADGTSRDAGMTTLEVVVIALGLFLVAGVLVVAITTAINTRLAQIN